MRTVGPSKTLASKEVSQRKARFVLRQSVMLWGGPHGNPHQDLREFVAALARATVSPLVTHVVISRVDNFERFRSKIEMRVGKVT